MKLLLDENLFDRIIPKIIDLYPNSEHVKSLRLTNTDDLIRLTKWAITEGDRFLQ